MNDALIFASRSLLRWFNLRNGTKWTHFPEHGAIVSYANFKYGAQHSHARYNDGLLSATGK